jgi:hypothetical protein
LFLINVKAGERKLAGWVYRDDPKTEEEFFERYKKLTGVMSLPVMQKRLLPPVKNSWLQQRKLYLLLMNWPRWLKTYQV